MQYADSLTKADSSQLLADRLRTHVTKITSDEGFQAAKQKDAHTRKRNTEMFAVKRASRAMQAMFMMGSTTLAQTTHNSTTTSTSPTTSLWILWGTFLLGLLFLLPLLWTMVPWEKLWAKEDPPESDDNVTLAEDNTTDASSQTESSNLTDSSTLTEWDLPTLSVASANAPDSSRICR